MENLELSSTVETGQKRILVVDSESHTRLALQAILTANQYKVQVSALGAEGLALASTWQPHLVILKSNLEDMDGTQFLEGLRLWSQIPILMFANENREEEIVRGLDSGADDYLVKPFGIEELLARIRAAFRHVPSENTSTCHQIENGALWIDLDQRIVRKSGQDVHLTRTEFELLAFLMANAGKMLTNEMILNQVWGTNDKEQVGYLRVYMSRLRKKLGDNFNQVQFIHNTSQAGYLLQ